MIRRRTLLGVAPAGLAGCATQRSVADGALGANQGVVALQLWSDIAGQLEFTPRGEWTGKAPVRGSLELKAGANQFLVLPLDAGSYGWSQIAMGRRYAMLFSSPFQIRSGQITYVGQIRVIDRGERFQSLVSDQAAQMQDFLRTSYPRYADTLNFSTAITPIRTHW